LQFKLAIQMARAIVSSSWEEVDACTSHFLTQ
jgi:hypothetical protein